ncbi:hypothetical protein [Niabella drilacis]|uniref:Uncharacterized protein n=1 Tax=Niabella drilacis (strain DSM 25811 / CCM 8410 / CCUG 62505 / LMG 26954 / E90) TaxID=1285928 RepID=A0A1G6I2H3_NIADE|nr:hypothetical protein [Niabella drilacis]SDC00737.1 hypothetical protein SAMN04487894_10171 [Niabella drilacis]
MSKIYFLIALGIIILPGCKKDKPEPDRCKNCRIAYKPNVYLYPLKETDLQVELSFPLGGSVIASIPAYHTGWKVRVAPSGKIDGQYDYLFYESQQPDNWQKNAGHVVSRDSLQQFFETDMAACQFKPKEISDFINYWIPRLKEAPYYAVYPQEKSIIDKLIRLHFSEQPDAVLRLFYLVKALDRPIKLSPYNKRETVLRHGFHVAEWGVILEP